MRATWCVVAAALVLVAAACGKSEDERRAEAAAEEVKQAAAKFEEAAKKAAEEGETAGADEIARGLEAMAQGLASAASAVGGDGKAVEPIAFRQLQSVFPAIPGWRRGRPTGEKVSSPVAYSQAHVRYTRGKAQIELKIVDSGFHQLLLAPYSVFLTSGYEKATESGYEKSTKVGAEPGWEKWNAASKSGEVNAVVAKRFLVQAEGRGVEDIAVLHDVLERADLAKLPTLQ